MARRTAMMIAEKFAGNEGTMGNVGGASAVL